VTRKRIANTKNERKGGVVAVADRGGGNKNEFGRKPSES
jgi:hypothetical protein